MPNSSGVYVSAKRLNKNGNPVWEKKYTTATVNHGLGSCLSYHSSSDGLKNVVITGTFTNTQGLDRLYVLELNGADGSIVHQMELVSQVTSQNYIYLPGLHQVGNYIGQTPITGGYAIGGYVTDLHSPVFRNLLSSTISIGLILKLDQNLSPLWGGVYNTVWTNITVPLVPLKNMGWPGHDTLEDYDMAEKIVELGQNEFFATGSINISSLWRSGGVDYANKDQGVLAITFNNGGVISNSSFGGYNYRGPGTGNRELGVDAIWDNDLSKIYLLSAATENYGPALTHLDYSGGGTPVPNRIWTYGITNASMASATPFSFLRTTATSDRVVVGGYFFTANFGSYLSNSPIWLGKFGLNAPIIDFSHLYAEPSPNLGVTAFFSAPHGPFYGASIPGSFTPKMLDYGHTANYVLAGYINGPNDSRYELSALNVSSNGTFENCTAPQAFTFAFSNEDLRDEHDFKYVSLSHSDIQEINTNFQAYDQPSNQIDCRDANW